MKFWFVLSPLVLIVGIFATIAKSKIADTSLSWSNPIKGPNSASDQDQARSQNPLYYNQNQNHLVYCYRLRMYVDRNRYKQDCMSYQGDISRPRDNGGGWGSGWGHDSGWGRDDGGGWSQSQGRDRGWNQASGRGWDNGQPQNGWGWDHGHNTNTNNGWSHDGGWQWGPTQNERGRPLAAPGTICYFCRGRECDKYGSGPPKSYRTVDGKVFEYKCVHVNKG